MIDFSNVCFGYGEISVLKNVSFHIKKGEFAAVLGANGAGKTTTIRMLSCLCTPSSGKAFIYGNDISKNKAAAKKLLNISPQETAVAKNLTVRENLMFIAGIYGSDKKSAAEKTDRIIDSLSMQEIASDKAGILSGGWQRRLSIAMALITEPSVLFLDEPTLGLDVLARRELWNIISGLKGKTTIILTTHYLEEAEALSDRIARSEEPRLNSSHRL